MLEIYSKCHDSPTNGPTGTQLGWSHPITFPTYPPKMGLPWQRPLPSNGAVDIQQLWASGGRTREPNLMEFGMQQQVRTTMTVMRSNIKIFKIQNGGRSLLESIRNAIACLQMDRLGRNFGGRIPSCSQYWKCYNSSYDGTDWDDSCDSAWSHPSNTSAAKPFPCMGDATYPADPAAAGPII